MLDTKLKNNKKAMRTAVIIVMLAALCFIVYVSIRYKGDAISYSAEFGDDFEEESFIRILFQCNYVLYPQVLEKSGKSFRTEDLYLSFEEEAASEAIYYGNEIISDRKAERLKADCILSVQQKLNQINELYTTTLSKEIDYCVIDEDTQTILKNTTKHLEGLRDSENLDLGYIYYFIVRYDANGVITDIRVYGNNSEMFLKNAQLVANDNGSLLFTDSQKVETYVVTDDFDEAAGRVTVTEKNPTNVTFIYAMTEEQMGNTSWFAVYQDTGYDTVRVTHYIGAYNYNKEQIYYRIVCRDYIMFLAVITGIFFVMARRLPQLTADTAGTRWSLEIIIFFQFILMSKLSKTVISWVYNIYGRNGSLYVPVNFDYIITYTFLFCEMFILFGAWYWCLLSIRGIFRGVRAFIRERSFIYRKWSRIIGFLKEIRDKCRKVLSEADLGKKNVRLLKGLVIIQFVILSFICCCWVFGIFILIPYSVLLYIILKYYIGKVQKQYGSLMQATNAIAQGKFDNDFESNFGVFESYKNELYQIQDGFGKAVEEEVKSQRMKTELITNVSHDLKTPLTAIITYIDLLKDENITEEQRRSYLDTLERKSLRLKVLIEDLFEISKASSGNVKLEPVSIDICNLMRQVYLEHEEKMNENGLDVRFDMPEEKIILQLDSQKTYRIFENLYVNIIKYAMPNTRVYIQVKRSDKIHIEVKNISAQELTVNPMDLTERFVRGDTSRNTDGSGLGLAIAKSFTQLQGGTFEIDIDGDLFKAVIEWKENL